MSEPKQIDDGGPAFPVSGHCVDASGAYCGEVVNSKGLSLRDWFAGQALAGYFAAPYTQHRNADDPDVAQYIWGMADAMLAARKDNV